MRKISLSLIRLLYTSFILTITMFMVYSTVILCQNLPGIRSTSEVNMKKLAKHVHALKYADGSRYCSSSSVKYKGKVYTLTNMHCCLVDSGLAQDEIRVGDSIEKILHISLEADVCIATSHDKSTPLKVSEKEAKYLDPLLIIGYPRGEELTPRYGHLIGLNYDVSVEYYGFVLTRPSHLVSALIFPGNSGSPVFNAKGHVVGLVYAGPHPLLQYAVIVPLRFIRASLEEAHKGH